MALSIEIRKGHVYLIEAKVTRNNIVVKKTHSFAFPEEWIAETGVVNHEGFGELLSQALKEQGIKDKDVILCINNQSMIYRELTLPLADDKKIPLLVRSEMIYTLNLAPNYIMDYATLETIEENGVQLIKVLAVAILDTALESYLEVMKDCKLKVQVVDSATNAMIKLLDQSPIFSPNQQAILADIADSHLRLYLFENGGYALSRNNKIPAYTDDNRNTILTSVVENINKMIQFSYTRVNGSDAKKVILTGLDELLPDIQKSVMDNLMVPCDILEKPLNVMMNYENRYVNALGTLIRRK